VKVVFLSLNDIISKGDVVVSEVELPLLQTSLTLNRISAMVLVLVQRLLCLIWC
jgi:hypothetical protein